MLSRTYFYKQLKYSTTRKFSTLTDINAANLRIEKTTNPKPKLPNDKLQFGKSFTDHMFEVDWTADKGWSTPLIRPYGPFQMDPASASLHYGVSCFEGMKAYLDENDEIRVFRPDMNMKRLKSSMNRLVLGDFNEVELLECLKKLLLLDRDWIPKGDGYSLYIRPTTISTHPYIGVGASLSAKIFIIMSPVGPYYPEGFNPVRLTTGGGRTGGYVRAWPGGSGGYKLGSNYTSGIKPQIEAGGRGYAQILGLFGPDDELTEVGTMNLFVHWINENGEKELLTPPLSRGDILPGVTRDSVLGLAKEWKEFHVAEANITMKQIQKAVNDNRLLEVFGTGTAAVISPVSAINYMGEDVKIPLTGKDGKIGPVAERLWRELSDIQYGRKPHPWSLLVK